MVDDRVTTSKLEHYLNLTKRAREKATRIHEEGTPEYIQLDILLRMADDYASDAKHFMDTGDYVRAFGAINLRIRRLNIVLIILTSSTNSNLMQLSIICVLHS